MSHFLKLNVITGKVLGVDVYRGFARLCDLAVASHADVYDQNTNPTGTQRDLSPKHAKQAYDYVRTRKLAFWPEVFLCARDPKAIKFMPDSPGISCGQLSIDLRIARRSKPIAISRVDGNHRLHYASGKEDGFAPLENEVSFCLAHGLTLNAEITLFRDINDNQRRMNTSHLDNIESRLTAEDRLKRSQPALYIAQQLGRAEESPLFGRVYEGGKRTSRVDIPLRGLKSGIQYMLSRPTKLTVLGDADAQFKVVRNFFEAVKLWQPDAWENPKDYLLLRGAGLWAVCFIGQEVIDRTLSKGLFSAQDMLSVLKSGKQWDWSTKGDFQGMSGRGGAAKISEQVTREFADDKSVSVKALYKQIMGS
jgi:DGQHR domain-containing protein